MLPRLKGSRRETKDEMAVTRATSLVSAVGLELELKFKGTDSTSNNEKKAVVGMGVGVEVKQNLKSKNQNLSLTLTPTKPSWVVRTEVSNHSHSSSVGDFLSYGCIDLICSFSSFLIDARGAVKCTERNKEEARPTMCGLPRDWQS